MLLCCVVLGLRLGRGEEDGDEVGLSILGCFVIYRYITGVGKYRNAGTAVRWEKWRGRGQGIC